MFLKNPGNPGKVPYKSQHSKKLQNLGYENLETVLITSGLIFAFPRMCSSSCPIAGGKQALSTSMNLQELRLSKDPQLGWSWTGLTGKCKERHLPALWIYLFTQNSWEQVNANRNYTQDAFLTLVKHHIFLKTLHYFGGRLRRNPVWNSHNRWWTKC